MRMITILALLLLVGCSSGKWYKSEGTVQDFNLDKHQCSIEAQSVGGAWAFHEGAVWSNLRLRRNFNSCMTSRGWEWRKD